MTRQPVPEPGSPPLPGSRQHHLDTASQQVSLTLLVEPHTTVHATMGLLPRKEIGVRREWVAAGLAALAATLPLGPGARQPEADRTAACP